jgi:glyoxylase-like metal-dependent hydrolase (beta-lactamase superfamily II)
MSCVRPSFRGVSRIAALTTLAAFWQIGSAVAEAPMQKTQAPGYFRMMVGEVEVTALFDGTVPLDAGMLKNVPQEEIKTLLQRAVVEDPRKLVTSVNAYLINTGEKLVLVDAGGGATFGGMQGRLRQNMRAAGYRPAQVDAVLITHLHDDHAAGLINAKGEAAFPNATVYLAKAENDFWFSEKEPEVPAQYKEFLKQARRMACNLSKAYLDAGRWKTFEKDNSPIAGIAAVPIPGHTPGHTAYEISSAGQKLVIIGDTVHFAAVQFARPEAAVSFDSDSKQAVATREALFRRLADGKAFVADMHVAFPGIGRMRSDEQKGYFFAPVEYAPLPAGMKK